MYKSVYNWTTIGAYNDSLQTSETSTLIPCFTDFAQQSFLVVKAVFQLRVLYTYVHARKSLNPVRYYIWSKQMFWWREYSISYDLVSLIQWFYLLNTNYVEKLKLLRAYT